LARAIGSEDVRTLTKTPGVGAKTAQRMTLELRDKMSALGFERRVDAIASTGKTRQKDASAALADDVVSALENLGYSRTDANRAAAAALEEKTASGPPPDFTILFRAALNRLTK
jgi:Holliday junction DNA helicase RuvA